MMTGPTAATLSRETCNSRFAELAAFGVHALGCLGGVGTLKRGHQTRTPWHHENCCMETMPSCFEVALPTKVPCVPNALAFALAPLDRLVTSSGDFRLHSLHSVFPE